MEKNEISLSWSKNYISGIEIEYTAYISPYGKDLLTEYHIIRQQVQSNNKFMT